MKSDDFILIESKRMDIYKTLSSFFQLPGTDIDDIDIQLKNFEKQLESLDSKSLDALKKMRGGLYNLNHHDDLLTDFSKLFIGPYNLLAPPYGSVYLEDGNRIMGESTADVIQKYRAAGIAISDDFKEAPDHISAELEFMYFLIFKEISSFQSDTAETFLTFLFQQKEFLQQHLGRWVEKLSIRIDQHAKFDFYRNLATVTCIFVKEDLDYLCDFDISGMEKISDETI